jgi:hypothetical protein
VVRVHAGMTRVRTVLLLDNLMQTGHGFFPCFTGLNHKMFADVVKNRDLYLSTSAAIVDAVYVEMICGRANR